MAGFTGASPIVTDGLVFAVDAANYESYPGSGTTWGGLAGSNNGTLTNGPLFDSNNGGSIDFDGSNDYIDFGDFDNTQVSSAITLSIWFNASYSNLKLLIGNGGGWSAGGFCMFMYNSKVRFELQGTGKKALDIPTSFFGQWQNMVGTWENGGLMRGYVNGSQVVTTSGITAISSNSRTGYLRMGGKGTNPGAPGLSTGYANANIALAQIYSKALLASEILQNYNALKSRFNL